MNFDINNFFPKCGVGKWTAGYYKIEGQRNVWLVRHKDTGEMYKPNSNDMNSAHKLATQLHNEAA